MKKYILLFVIILSVVALNAQDTILIMQYNLLNYGNYTSYCNSNNNNVSNKDNYIKSIINYVKPDIFSVNEMVAQEAMMEHLKGKINETWTNKYKRPPFESESSDYLANTIYYNSEKLSFKKQFIAQNNVRDVNVYEFYYNSSDLESGDTAFIYCVVAHLKAGSGTSNSNKRKIMANNTMNFIKNYDPENNYLVMGDFNLYSSSEPAWNIFTNYSDERVRLNDPINKAGDWNNNYSYRNYHTQSTHENSTGCAAGGGMDDRFDFILISNDVKNGTKKVKYVNGSYHALGQDGKHFNTSINASPTNTSVPSNVLNALYHNSDHLPVVMKLAVNQPVGIKEKQPALFRRISFMNPVNRYIKLKFDSEKNTEITVSVIDITGKIIKQEKAHVFKGNNKLRLEIKDVNPGFYILRLTDKNGLYLSKKIIKR